MKLKLLLVISRPDGSEDVAYRVIASTVFEAIRTSPRFDILVLRPPTYGELARVLRDAASDGSPYDLVHFDGHGFYQGMGMDGSVDEAAGGQIIFEHDRTEGGHAVSGTEFAALASECDVKAVVLNACRSAYEETSEDQSSRLGRPPASFAHALLVAGVPAVIAMNFNVYVASAKRFMEEFYRQLERGESLSVAASLARKHLSTDKKRFQKDSSEIDDWLVPAIYQNGCDLQMEPIADVSKESRGLTLPPSFRTVRANHKEEVYESLVSWLKTPDPQILYIGAHGSRRGLMDRRNKAPELMKWEQLGRHLESVPEAFNHRVELILGACYSSLAPVIWTNLKLKVPVSHVFCIAEEPYDEDVVALIVAILKNHKDQKRLATAGKLTYLDEDSQRLGWGIAEHAQASIVPKRQSPEQIRICRDQRSR